jgi:hypothetical protein
MAGWYYWCGLSTIQMFFITRASIAPPFRAGIDDRKNRHPGRLRPLHGAALNYFE